MRIPQMSIDNEKEYDDDGSLKHSDDDDDGDDDYEASLIDKDYVITPNRL
jgi:hypothetical protein